ncbi:MAG: PLP-dependent aminotransferase family protein [Thermoguttaceae bacterium]
MTDRTHLSQRAQWAGGESLASRLVAKELGHPNLISLAVGFVDHETLPIEPTRQALEHVLANDALARSALQYCPTFGHLPLRQIVLDRMLAADGCKAAELNAAAENVVVMPGSNQLLFVAADILMNPGDIILCAAPTYYVFLGGLNNLGVRAVGVATDHRGIIPEAVEEALARCEAAGELDRVKALYLIDYFDNPRSVTIPSDRRAAIVEIVKRWSRRQRIYIFEDAAYRELRYAGDDVPSLRSFDTEGDTVLYAGTFSKSYAPGIRVGWGVLPKSMTEPMLAQKGNIDFGSPHLNQVLMATAIELGLYDRHVERLRTEYRRKVDVILQASDEFLRPISGIEWIAPAGGLYLWLTLPEGLDTGFSGPLFDRAVAEGVLYVPGAYCYPAEGCPGRDNRLRLSFGCQSRDNLRCGMEALARAIRQCLT